MQKPRLKLYHIDLKYIRNLAKIDDHVMSVSPQTGKANRPFVGVVIICDEKEYCIPLTSPKPKHEAMKNAKDFMKMFDKKGKLIGCLNFNNMLPVSSDVLIPVNMRYQPWMNAQDRAYIDLLNNQLDWCNDHRENIVGKAGKLYRIITETPDKFPFLTKRCCDFRKLEQMLEDRN